MRRFILGSFAFAAALSTAAVSRAHIDMLAPAPRHVGNDTQKTGPCGTANSTRTNNPTVLDPGATITVTWDETIEHGGHFRLLFDEDGTDFPAPVDLEDICTPGDMVAPGVHCLMDNIPDQLNAPNYSVDVTLPNIECQNCTLQLIQVMANGTMFAGNYFECADLVLGDPPVGTGGGGGGTSGTGGAGQGGDPTTSSSSASSGSGSGGNGAQTTDDPLYQPEDTTCGCRVVGLSGGETSAAAMAALGLLALASRRRRAGR